MPTNTAAI
jgi:hypothetical protein